MSGQVEHYLVWATEPGSGSELMAIYDNEAAAKAHSDALNSVAEKILPSARSFVTPTANVVRTTFPPEWATEGE